jgi:hypothetical protein
MSITYRTEIIQRVLGGAMIDHFSHRQHHQGVEQSVDREPGLVDREDDGSTLHSQPCGGK